MTNHVTQSLRETEFPQDIVCHILLRSLYHITYIYYVLGVALVSHAYKKAIALANLQFVY